MRWKDGIIIALIFFGFGIIVGYSLYGYPTFESIRNWIIGGLSAGIVIGVVTVGIKLVEFLKGWSIAKEAKHRNHSEESLYPALQSFTAKLYFENGRFIPTISNDKYYLEAESHIESGYLKTAWEYKKKRDSFINIYNPKFQDLSKAAAEKIIKCIRQKNPSLSAWNGRGNIPTKYYRPDFLHSDIEYIVAYSYKQTFDFDSSVYIEQYNKGQWRLRVGGVSAVSDSRDELLEIKQAFKVVLADVLIKEDFKKLMTCYGEIIHNHELFVKSINAILKDVENKIPLRGKCEICKKF